MRLLIIMVLSNKVATCLISVSDSRASISYLVNNSQERRWYCSSNFLPHVISVHSLPFCSKKMSKLLNFRSVQLSFVCHSLSKDVSASDHQIPSHSHDNVACLRMINLIRGVINTGLSNTGVPHLPPTKVPHQTRSF